MDFGRGDVRQRGPAHMVFGVRPEHAVVVVCRI